MLRYVALDFFFSATISLNFFFFILWIFLLDSTFLDKFITFAVAWHMYYLFIDRICKLILPFFCQLQWGKFSRSVWRQKGLAIPKIKFIVFRKIWRSYEVFNFPHFFPGYFSSFLPLLFPKFLKNNEFPFFEISSK